MKHILEFNLPEEKEDLDVAMNAGKYHSFIHELMHSKLRSITKYGTYNNKNVPLVVQEFIEQLKDDLWADLSDNNIGDKF